MKLLFKLLLFNLAIQFSFAQTTKKPAPAKKTTVKTTAKPKQNASQSGQIKSSPLANKPIEETAKPAEETKTNTPQNSKSGGDEVADVFRNSGSKSLLIKENDLFIDLHLGLLGGRHNESFGGGRWPYLMLNAAVEKAIVDKISLGGFVGIYRRTYRPYYFGSRYKGVFSGYTFGACASLHLVEILNSVAEADLDKSQLDLYTRFYAGLNHERLRWRDNNSIFNDSRYMDTETRIMLGLTLGGRYKVSDNLMLMSELGWGPNSSFSVGVTIKP